MLTQYDVENLWKILQGEGDWFTAKLLRLIAKGDMHNRRKLYRAYPVEVHVINTHNWGWEKADKWKNNLDNEEVSG